MTTLRSRGGHVTSLAEMSGLGVRRVRAPVTTGKCKGDPVMGRPAPGTRLPWCVRHPVDAARRHTVWTESVRSHWEPVKLARDAGLGHRAPGRRHPGPSRLHDQEQCGAETGAGTGTHPGGLRPQLPRHPTAVDSTTATDNIANVCYQDRDRGREHRANIPLTIRR